MSLRKVNALDALKAFIAEHCQGSQKIASGKLGCTPQFVSDLVNDKKSIPDAMLPKIYPGLHRASVVEK